MAVTGRYLATQPETLIVALVVVIGYMLTHVDNANMNHVSLGIAHFGAFALLFGSQFWVTFIAGLTMFKILPRQWFSKVQSTLFPKFFMYCVIFSGISLISFYLITDQVDKWYKLAPLFIVLVTSACNSVLVTPTMNAVLEERNAIEKRERVGQGIGEENKDCAKLRETNSEYDAIYSRFVKLHGASALFNLVSFAGSAMHVVILAYHARLT